MADSGKLTWWALDDTHRRALLFKYENKERIDYEHYAQSAETLHRYIRGYRQELTGTPGTYTTARESEQDSTVWQAALDGLKAKQQYAKVMHLSDIHWPYSDDNALRLALNIARHVEPDIVVVGSDAFDFDLLSSFGIDPDSSEDDDELDRVQRYWLPFLHDLHAAAPNAAKVFIFGNHERRLIHYVIRHAPQLRKTIWRRFREIIRADGAVLWLGEIDAVRVGDTLIQHGTRHGVYAAKGHLDDLGYQLNTIFGHSHRLSYHQKAGALKTVKAVGGGCLCDTNPHYQRGRSMRGRWQQGTVVADIALNGGSSDFINLEFTDSGAGLQTRLGFTTIKAQP